MYVATFLLAFCSIVYELLLGQALSAFLGNTVLRLSVTVGLYMLCMGVGAFLAGARVLRRPVLGLQRVEVLLTLLGGSSVVSLFVLDSWGAPPWLVSVVGHGAIVAIGILSGLELPLLLELARRQDDRSRGRVLGVDYVGAFVGTLAFAFWFYPRAGLVPTAFAVATTNAVVGALLVTQLRYETGPARGPHLRTLSVQALLLAAGFACLFHAREISEHCVALYVGGAS